MELEQTPGIRHEVTDDNPLVPIIWPHRVRWIEFVGPDDVEEWERVMAEEVRAQPVSSTGGQPRAMKPGCGTKSGSYNGWDDSDYWGNGC